MIGHWLASAWRSISATPVLSAIAMLSLTIGLCGALLAGSIVKQHLTFEQWLPGADRIGLVRMRLSSEATERFGDEAVFLKQAQDVLNPALRHALEGRVPGLAAQARAIQGSPLLESETDRPSTTLYVDAEFFHVFELPFAEGDSRTALSEPDFIVLTQKEARRLFGEEPALGRIVAGAGGARVWRIGGVLKELPRATHLSFDVLAGMDVVERNLIEAGRRGDLSQWRQTFPGRHYIRVSGGKSGKDLLAAAESEIASITSARGASSVGGMRWTYSLTPLLNLHLAGPDVTGIPSSGDAAMLLALAGGALILLAISAFNYLALSMARSLRQRQEVAIRKVLGATRRALRAHFLVESILATAISMLAAFGLAVLLQDWFSRSVGQPAELTDLSDPIFLAGSLATSILLALAIGAYPAFQLARVRPADGLRTSSTSSLSPGARILSRILLGLQLAGGTVLLVVALAMAAQSQYIAARPIGFSFDDVYELLAPCPATTRGRDRDHVVQCQRQFLAILKQIPGVRGAAAYDGDGLVTENVMTRPFSQTASSTELGKAALVGVDTDFLGLVNAKLLAGRLFDGQSIYDQPQRAPASGAKPASGPTPVIVTRSLLPLLEADQPRDALGRRITFKDGEDRSFEIVGVVEDWNQRSLRHPAHPIIFAPKYEVLQTVARIGDRDVAGVLALVNQAWRTATGLERAEISVRSLRTAIEDSYGADRDLLYSVLGFAGLSIVVAMLGVFGLSSLDVRRRVPEIGLRKALGASTRSIRRMFVGRAVAFALAASIAAWPIGYWLALQWLNGFAYRTSLGALALPAASLSIVAIAGLAVALTTIHAAALSPSRALGTG